MRVDQSGKASAAALGHNMGRKRKCEVMCQVADFTNNATERFKVPVRASISAPVTFMTRV